MHQYKNEKISCHIIKQQNSVTAVHRMHGIRAVMLSNEGFPGGAAVENPPPNAEDPGDRGSIPVLGRSPGIGNGNPLQYSCLENFMDRGAWCPVAWWATVHGVTESVTAELEHACRVKKHTNNTKKSSHVS